MGSRTRRFKWLRFMRASNQLAGLLEFSSSTLHLGSSNGGWSVGAEQTAAFYSRRRDRVADAE